MKQYMKPTVDVVELSVKESIAANGLPNALVNVKDITQQGGTTTILTTYNLAAASTSATATE